jgi:hypothetical protein
MGSSFVWKSVQDTQLARHALGDAHGDAFFLPESENYEAEPEELCPAHLDLFPWNA